MVRGDQQVRQERTETAYNATCVQVITRVVGDHNDAKKVIHENLQRSLELVDYVFTGPRCGSRLILFPGFFLTSVPESRSCEGYRRRAVEIPGEATGAFGEKAHRHSAYIAGNCFEVDPEW